MAKDSNNPFRFRRIALGLSQRELAKRCDVTSNTILNWEHDVSVPRYSLIDVLATALEVEVETIHSWLGQQCARVLTRRLEKGAA